MNENCELKQIGGGCHSPSLVIQTPTRLCHVVKATACAGGAVRHANEQHTQMLPSGTHPSNVLPHMVAQVLPAILHLSDQPSALTGDPSLHCTPWDLSHPSAHSHQSSIVPVSRAGSVICDVPEQDVLLEPHPAEVSGLSVLASFQHSDVVVTCEPSLPLQQPTPAYCQPSIPSPSGPIITCQPSPHLLPSQQPTLTYLSELSVPMSFQCLGVIATHEPSREPSLHPLPL